MQEQTTQAGADQPRINVRRIAKKMLLALVLPVVLAIAVDFTVGAWPFITLIVSAVVFPIAGIIVLRTAMEELNQVIQELAPEDGGAPESTAENSAAADV